MKKLYKLSCVLSGGLAIMSAVKGDVFLCVLFLGCCLLFAELSKKLENKVDE